MLALPERRRFLRGLRAWVGFRQVGVALRAGGAAGRRVEVHAAEAASGWRMTASSRSPACRSGSSSSPASCSRAWRSRWRWPMSPGRSSPPERFPSGFASLIVSIWFFAGVQLLCLGIVGEYVARTCDEARGRPYGARPRGRRPALPSRTRRSTGSARPVGPRSTGLADRPCEHDYGASYARLYREHWWWRAREAILLDELAALGLRPGDGRQILDVGCGDGLAFDALGRFGERPGHRGRRSPARPERPAPRPDRHAPAGRPVYDDPAWRFDLITALDVLEHIDDDRAAVASMAAMLRPGGLLVVTVPAFKALWDEHDAINHHRRRYTAGGLDRLARRPRAGSGAAPLPLPARCSPPSWPSPGSTRGGGGRSPSTASPPGRSTRRCGGSAWSRTASSAACRCPSAPRCSPPGGSRSGAIGPFVPRRRRAVASSAALDRPRRRARQWVSAQRPAMMSLPARKSPRNGHDPRPRSRRHCSCPTPSAASAPSAAGSCPRR